MRIFPCAALFFFAATAFLLTPRAHAQIGIYGELSASDFNLANTDWQYGSTFGLYYNHWGVPFFGLGVDARGSVVGSGSTKIVSGLVGPRLVFKPHVLPIMPYVEAVVGAGDAQYGEGVAATNTTKLEYQFLGGVDYTILPRIDWRVVEFSYGGFSGQSFNPRNPQHRRGAAAALGLSSQKGHAQADKHRRHPALAVDVLPEKELGRNRVGDKGERGRRRCNEADLGMAERVEQREEAARHRAYAGDEAWTGDHRQTRACQAATRPNHVQVPQPAHGGGNQQVAHRGEGDDRCNHAG